MDTYHHVKCTYSKFKSRWSFHLITVEKSKVSLETQSVNFNPLKIKKSNYVLPTYNGTHPHPQREESEYSEEMLSQSVTNPAGQTPHAAAPCPRSKGSNAPPLRYVPWGTSTPCVHSPWQVSHGSGISNTLGSLPQHKLHFHSLLIGLSGLLSTPTPGVPGFTSCLNCGGRTQEHLHLFASPNVYHMNDTAKFN